MRNCATYDNMDTIPVCLCSYLVNYVSSASVGNRACTVQDFVTFSTCQAFFFLPENPYFFNMNSLRFLKRFSSLSPVVSNVGVCSKRYMSYYPVDDNISGLNSEQKQVCYQLQLKNFIVKDQFSCTTIQISFATLKSLKN